MVCFLVFYFCGTVSDNIDMDVNMVADVGRRPLAQVLRNSLSGHPPTTGTTRCHVLINSRQAADGRL